MGVSAKGSEASIKGPSNAIAELTVKYGFKSGLLGLKELRDDLQSTKEYGDDFKVKFALLALGVLFCPSMKPGINQYFLHSLLDVSTLSKKNWAKLVLDSLVKGIHQFKENKQEGTSGCLFILMLFYFEKFIPCGLPSTFTKTDSYPMMGMWGNDEVSARVRFLRIKGLFQNKKILLETPIDKPSKESLLVDAVKDTPSADATNDTHQKDATKDIPPIDSRLRTWMDKVDMEVAQLKSDIQSMKDDLNSLKAELSHTLSLVNEMVARGHQQQRQRENSPEYEHQFCPDSVVDLSAFKTAGKIIEAPILVPRSVEKRKKNDISYNGSSPPPPAFETPLAPVEDVSPTIPAAKKSCVPLLFPVIVNFVPFLL